MLTRALRRADQQQSARPAVIGPGAARWGEVAARVARLAGGLRAAGVGVGDRVAILAQNRPEYLEYYFAVAWAGGVLAPMNNRHTPHEVAQCLADCEARALVADAAHWEAAKTAAGGAPSIATIVAIDPAPGAALTWPDLARAAPIADAERKGQDLAGVFYTGGTTGRPKGVMLSHDNLWLNAMNTLAELEYRSRDVYLHAGPMFHLADGASTLALTLVGAAHAFLPRFTIPELIDALESHAVTAVTLVPTMIQRLVEAEGVERRNLSRLRTLLYGAAPIADSVLRRAMAVLPGCGFIQAYGMTELSPIATILPKDCHRLDGPHAARLRSAGRATFGVEVKIVDENGQEVARGGVGEVVVRGPTVMLGYWNRPGETDEALRGGWMHTGDAASMDEDGFIYIRDRLKDMIVTGGENVYSAEVENAFYSCPGVAQCAVIGVPSAEWGEAVHAVVALEPGARLTEADLRAHIAPLLASYKRPKTIDIRAEPLPLSGAGKILKTELRKPYWAGVERSVN